MRGVRTSFFAPVILVCSLTSGVVSAAASDGKPPPPAAQAAFAEGKRLYDAGDKKAAAEKFKEAYRLSSNALLLYNIAFVYDELGDGTLATHYYKMFLDKAQGNPKAEANRKLATDRVAAIEMEEQEKAAAAAQESKVAAAKPMKIARSNTLEHDPVDEARTGKAIEVAANCPLTWKLSLFYRRAGDEQFQMVPLAEDNHGRMVAMIPARAVAKGAIHYYLEAKDEKGAVVAHSGEAASPNLVEISGTAPIASTVQDEESPLEENTAAPRSDSAWTTRRTVKWALTGASVLALGGGLMAYITWGNYRSTLRDELKDRCGDMPCSPMTDYELELKDGRDMWKLINWTSMGAGVALAGAAGYFWYMDLRDANKSQQAAAKTGAVSAAPILSPGYVGASAVVTF